MCEWIVESFALHPEVETRFVAVRFGNVLGSSGSVIPIFRRQIERGGPVTVTNPEMTRFFMTIPEASSLVVQAGAMGGRGQVYVLDMGEPVRILDLAKQMIRLSGRDEEEIPIVFTGARAGEKVHEVLWNEGEAVGPTSHPKIMRAARPQIDAAWLEESLAELERLVDEGDTLGVVARLGSMVSEPVRTGPRRSSKTRCTDVTAARRRRRYGGSVDVLDGPEPRAAACRRGGARARLHPRRRRLGQDDDDHAADRAAGCDRRVRARTQILAVTFTDKAAGELRARLAALGVRGRAAPRRSTPRRCGSCGTSRPSDVGRILPSKALAAPADREPAARARSSSGRRATSRPRSSGRRTAAIGPDEYRARRPIASRRSRST